MTDCIAPPKVRFATAMSAATAYYQAGHTQLAMSYAWDAFDAARALGAEGPILDALAALDALAGDLIHMKSTQARSEVQ